MAWTVILVDEVADWYLELANHDPETAKLVAAAIDLLEAKGPALGRPLVDSIEGSSIHNMKELRPSSRGRSEIRMLFVFDPARQAVLLVAGDKGATGRLGIATTFLLQNSATQPGLLVDTPRNEVSDGAKLA